ncbi:hypothetical protein KP509_07G032100 [Ceratopteris richardii]|uniref:Uncharacterized protein n=1 Tax=Ceratopteris richardii TaxID=49495 RepID=A0A8T2UDA5_CERRI|nr:hypothetical protein KP509_07G032100 [Ceratopteris richardii]
MRLLEQSADFQNDHLQVPLVDGNGIWGSFYQHGRSMAYLVGASLNSIRVSFLRLPLKFGSFLVCLMKQTKRVLVIDCTKRSQENLHLLARGLFFDD